MEHYSTINNFNSTIDFVLTLFAKTIGTRDPSLRASAHHSAHRDRIEDTASRVLEARVNRWAGVDAGVGDAGEFARAVDVKSALGLVLLYRRVSLAEGEGVADWSAFWTATGSHVVLDVADGVLGTHGLYVAWVLALLVQADVALGTVVVAVALDSLAKDRRLAEVTRWAATSRLMVHSEAFRVYGAVVLQDARVHAMPVVASVRVTAVVVRLAFH